MQKIFVSLFLFASLGSSVYGACNWPNGTDLDKHWWQAPSNIFTIYSLTAMTSHGQLEYPIHLGSTLVTLAFVNNPGPAITQIQQDVAIAEWDSSNCKWNTLQTFGLL